VELTATASYFMLLGGVLVACVEFLRPGLVVPGVVGGVAAVWGLSRLAADGLNWGAAGLFLLGAALLAVESWSFNKDRLGWRRWVRWIGALGASAMWWGSVNLVETPSPIDPWAAGIGVALFAIVTVPLLDGAFRARKNKTSYQ
jgi:membrane-bound serine protease (ClpP class)